MRRQAGWRPCVALTLALLVASAAGALTATVTAANQPSPTPTFSPEPDPCGGVCDGRTCYLSGGGSGFSCRDDGDGCRCRYVTPTPTVDPDLCAGDCDGDRDVTVAELVTVVAIALGEQTRSACAVGLCGFGRVSIACLVRGVGNAIAGCPPFTRPTHTPSPTPTPVRTLPAALDAAVAALCSDYRSVTTRVNVDGYAFDCQQFEHGIEAELAIFASPAAATAALDLVRPRGSATDFHGLDAVSWLEMRAGGVVMSDYLVWTNACWLVSTSSTTALPAPPEHTAREVSEALYRVPGLFDACGALP